MTDTIKTAIKTAAKDWTGMDFSMSTGCPDCLDGHIFDSAEQAESIECDTCKAEALRLSNECEQAAKTAAEWGATAIADIERGDIDEALVSLTNAAAEERQWGDAPTWDVPLDLLAEQIRRTETEWDCGSGGHRYFDGTDRCAVNGCDGR